MIKNNTKATSAIRSVYRNSSNVRKWQCSFSRFRSGDFGLSDVAPSGGPAVVNNDELGSLIETNSRQTVQNLMNRLGASQFPPCSNISAKQENCTGKEYEYHVTFVESI